MSAAATSTVIRAVGSLVEVRPAGTAALNELARVGEAGLFGEIVRIENDVATLQVYEDTAGITLGDAVTFAGRPLTIELGPGLLGSTLDGVGRPLSRIAERWGSFIAPGTEARALDAAVRWTFTPTRAVGERVNGGDVLGTVRERQLEHRILVPPNVTGTIAALRAGAYTIDEAIGALGDGSVLRLTQHWAIRRPRPAAERLPTDRPFVTAQRVFDLLFPVAEGGTAAVPGGFGTGKTIIEQSLAKYASADVIVYVGCGERGNEMADVLAEFPELVDPTTGGKVMDRAVLIVNTSNMPVAAREASIYLGITIAEYYRDMGYRAALMVDSLSRWAEARREMAGRLKEMPGEEGYPTSLASQLGRFFERAGRVRASGAPEREGAVTTIAAISPPGGDFSEPVTQAALRVSGAVWALDAGLAHQRHFPAVDWEASYSLYDDLFGWRESRLAVVALLQRERELRDITSLVGPEALEDVDRLTMAVAAIARETVLRQNATDPADAASSPDKTHALATLVAAMDDRGRAALAAGQRLGDIDLGPARRALVAVRDAPPSLVATRAEAARTLIGAIGT